VIQKKSTKVVSETRLRVWVESDDFDRNIEFLSRLRCEPEEPVLQRILNNVGLIVKPNWKREYDMECLDEFGL
jgi:hypothetical protein